MVDALIMVREANNVLGCLRRGMHRGKLAEVWGQRVEVTAFVAQRCPRVGDAPARIQQHHEVQRGAATEHLAARLVDLAAVKRWLRNGCEIPVVLGLAIYGGNEAMGQNERIIAVVGSGLHDENSSAAIFSEAGSDD